MRKSLLIFVLTVVCILSGCSEYSVSGNDSGYSTGILVSPEVIDSIAAAVSAAQTEKYPRETDTSGNRIVFWTEGGLVWHESRACASIASAAAYESGSTEDAVKAGKTRACMICGEKDDR